MNSAQLDLSAAAEELWQVVSELALTVIEDHPVDNDLVFVDDLMDRVSDLQAAGAELRQAALSGALAEADEAADSAVLLYWRDLRSYRPIYELRRAARQRQGEWLGWAVGVEQALERCAQPINASRTAIRAAWRASHQPAIPLRYHDDLGGSDDQTR